MKAGVGRRPRPLREPWTSANHATRKHSGNIADDEPIVSCHRTAEEWGSGNESVDHDSVTSRVGARREQRRVPV